MSIIWVEDVDGDLINLDKMETVAVVKLEDPNPANSETHAVIARTPSIGTASEEYWLAIGSEDFCRTNLARLKGRLL